MRTAARKRAREEISAAIELLEKLIALQPSMERESLTGSAYKRLALIERAAGSAQRENAAIARMLGHYEAAERLGIERQCSNLFYPALNRMAAQLVLGTKTRKGPGLDGAAVARVRTELETLARDAPDFWCIAAQSELSLYEAIAAGELAKRQKQLAEGFSDLHRRVDAPRLWTSVADSAAFVLPRYRAWAKQRKGEGRAADALLAVLGGFASRDKESDPK